MSRVGALGDVASRRSLTIRLGEPGPGSDRADGEVGSGADGAEPMGDPCIPRRLEDARAGGAPSSAAMFEAFALARVARIMLLSFRLFNFVRCSLGRYPNER